MFKEWWWKSSAEPHFKLSPTKIILCCERTNNFLEDETMAKLNSFLWTMFVLSLAATANIFATEVFLDNFDGTAVDESKWIVSTGPPRFRQDGPTSESGYWVTPSGNPPYGTVAVSNSWVSLWNGYSTVFPYVVSQINPFPETDAFILEFKMRYDSVNPHGTGFQVRYADSENPLANTIYYVWQGSGSNLSIELLGSSWRGALSDTSEHIYRLEYVDGKYTALIDGAEIIGPTASSMKPNQIWFGNPVWAWWGSRYWTTFSVDYITVVPEPATVLLLGFGGLALRRRRRA
jgi:hypothetical protein